jgi:multifunctional 2-oxoglutarate metabolism enzyme
MPDTATVQIAMPEMGESVTEGIVLEWHVAEGDTVSEGDTVVEVSTDKIDAEVPAPADGVITKLLVHVDDEVKVGAPLAEMEATGEVNPDSPALGSAENGSADASPSDNGSGSSPSTEGTGETLVVAMPEMGESVTEGVVLEWHVAEGDSVSAGDTVVEVSTDKVDAEVPAPADGVITRLLVQVDDEVKVGAPLAEMEASVGVSAADDGAGGTAPEEALATGRGGGSPAPAGPAAETPADATDVRATPVARRVAAANGVDLGSVKGSGPGAKVTKEDVLAAQGNGARTAAPSAAGEPKQLRGPAAMLAKAMDESRAVPTATSFRTIAVDTLDAKRKAINGVLKDRGLKVSFTHLIAWAIVQATKEFPVMVRSFEERDDKPFAIEDGPVNLGIAVDVERKDGSHSLMVPAIKGAQGLDFATFHSHYEELIAKTRESKLTADDFQGTNISLTNPGGIGTVASVPRLLKGQSAIIATGSIAYPPEWLHASPERLKQIGVAKVMTLTSTYDHRVIQGAESGAFLRRIEQLLQGEDGFYESVAADLGIDPAGIASAHPASASAPPLTAAPPSAEPSTAPGEVDEELLQAVQAATSLLKAYRTHGHLAAHLDPLGSEPKGDPALQPENVNLTPELMERIPASILRIGVPGETLLEALPRMRDAYCGTIAYQFEHLSSHQQRIWLREMIETGAHRQPLTDAEKKRLLNRLIDVFQFERFLEKAYLGQKMFSIEGLDVVVPMLDEVVTLSHRGGAEEVVFGMAHRGRLSVLAHNLGRSVESILAEFEGAKQLGAVKAVAAIPHGGTGDVKYHYGHRGTYETSDGEQISVRLYPNPSHLEFVDPVVTGGTRYLQSEFDGPVLKHDSTKAVPVLLHGDAAFPAQGVVAETLNLQALKGYATGGTVHVIQNNQVGFTTDPEEARSTPYAADMAKGFNVPIIHVNADDVEACTAAMRLAMAYRERWSRDVVIDVIGYRRFGHNETDEPAYTQPTMAARIKSHPPVSEIYARGLVEEGVVGEQEVAGASERRRKEMATALKELREKMEAGDYEDPTVTGTTTSTGELLDRTASPPVDTKVPAERLRALNEELLKTPEGFNVHRKLRRPLQKRTEALESGGIEFGQAEALAFGSLLTEGVHIRLTGQDSERGTFSHRHLVLHDENTGLRYTPMQHLEEAKAPFELHNSPLSEIACLGFEYGYSAATPNALVLWEAQFGDFANAAQVIIDSFIVSGEAKWGQTSRLTLLLPHGYEGSGPEHSSARIERFLALGAEGNIRIAYPTTAAQYFHLLRRQALIRKPRPLIVFTPKGLLRLDKATARLDQLTDEHFHYILDDARAVNRREKVERLVLCTGKVYFDIDGNERRESAENVAVARVEMLYPFAREQLEGVISVYPNLKEVTWVQEEPRNMGAWKVMSRRLPDILPEGVALTYIGRQGRASPGEGYSGAHALEQERIVLTALTPGS